MLLLTEISRFRKQAWLPLHSHFYTNSFGYISKKDFPNFSPLFIAQRLSIKCFASWKCLVLIMLEENKEDTYILS